MELRGGLLECPVWIKRRHFAVAVRDQLVDCRETLLVAGRVLRCTCSSRCCEALPESGEVFVAEIRSDLPAGAGAAEQERRSAAEAPRCCRPEMQEGGDRSSESKRRRAGRTVGACAFKPRLGLLEAAVRERSPHIDDAEATVDVTLLEAEQLRGPEPGRSPEDDHWPIERTELGGDRFDLLPALERPLLPRPPWRVADASLGGVEVDQAPLDRPGQNLPECLRCLEPVSFGHGQPPGVDILR